MRIKAAMVVVLLLAFAVCALAQAPATGARNGRRNGMLQNPAIADLGLTQEQTEKLGGIIRQYRMDSRAISQDTGTDAEKQTKIDALKTTAVANINKILTPEQLEKAKSSDIINKLLAPRQRPANNGTPGTETPGANTQRRGFGIARFFDQLGLSDAQKADIEKINQATKDSVKAINDDTSLDAAAKRAKIMPIFQSSQDQIKALLTAEQKTKLEELMKNAPVHTGNADTPTATPAPTAAPAAQADAAPMANTQRRGFGMARFFDQLNLTDEQKTEVEKINKTTQDSLKAINDDTSLDKATKRGKLAILFQSSQDQIKALLTAEQKTKLEELMKNARPNRGGSGNAKRPVTN